MKYLLHLATFSFFLLASCESKKEKSGESSTPVDSVEVPTAINNDACPGGVYIKYAHAYNNFIVENQGYILEGNIEFNKAIKKHESNEKVRELYDELVNETAISIDTLEKLCAFNGDHEYKKSAIKLFKFYQEVWKDYKPLLEIKNEKEKAKILESLKKQFNEKHSKKEKHLEEEFMKAHTHFANEYRLHIRSTSLHEELDSLLSLK